MKSILVIGLLLCLANAGFSQCDKKVSFTSNRHGELLDDSTVENERELDAVITFTKDSINMRLEAPNGPMIITCAVSEKNCSINSDYTSGKMEVKAACSRFYQGDTSEASFKFKLEIYPAEIRFYAERERPEGGLEKTRFYIVEKKVNFL